MIKIKQNQSSISGDRAHRQMARASTRQKPRHCLQMVHQYPPAGFIYLTANIKFTGYRQTFIVGVEREIIHHTFFN